MSTIITNLQISQRETGSQIFISNTGTTLEDGMIAVIREVGSVKESLDMSNLVTPKQVILRLVSGDDLYFGTVEDEYPFRLSGAGDYAVLRLNFESLRETVAVTCEDDVNGSLNSTHIKLFELGNTEIRPWFNMATSAFATLTLTDNVSVDNGVTIGGVSYVYKASPAVANQIDQGADLATSLANLVAAINGAAGEGTLYGTGTVAHPNVTAEVVGGNSVVVRAKTPGVAGNEIAVAETLYWGTWSPVDFLAGGADAGTAPTAVGVRLIQVNITENDTADAIATTLAAALNADAAFASATAVGAVVTIVDQYLGDRNTATVGDTSWSTISITPATFPTVYLKSAGTSLVQIGVIPN